MLQKVLTVFRKTKFTILTAILLLIFETAFGIINPPEGIIGVNQNICSGSQPDTILSIVDGLPPAVYQWEYSSTADFSSDVHIIPSSNSPYYIPPLLSSTTYFRRGWLNAGPIRYTNIVTISIAPLSVGGIITGDFLAAGVCAGNNSMLLTLTGYTGSIIKWQSSTTSNFSANVIDIANTTDTYTALNLTVTTYYRAVVQSGTCSPVNSSTKTVWFYNLSGGAISGGTAVCIPTNSTLLTLSGYNGSGIILRWESSTVSDFTSNVTTINNTNTTYTANNVVAKTFYRAVVDYPTTCVATSAIDSITILPATIGGTISGGANVCTGTNSTVLTLSGHTGNISRWESALNADFSGPIIQISNTTTSYSAINLTVKTFFRAFIKNGTCDSSYSSIDSVLVNPLPSGGTLIGSDSICVSAIASNNLLTLSSYTGNIVKWQSSFTPDFSSQVTDISNTNDTYSALSITQTTYYRAIVSNGICTDTSSIAQIFVTPPSVGGNVTNSNPFSPNVIVCAGTNSSTLILSGHTGTIIKWQSSLTSNFSGTVTDIANTTSSLTVTNLTTTTFYRVVVKNGDCNEAFSSVKVITVNPITNAGDVSSDTVCTGTNSSVLRLTNYIGAITKWQSSSSNDFTSGVVDISNTTDSLVVTNINAAIFYRVIVKSGVCSADTSTIGHILVNVPTVAGTLSGGDTVCAGVNATTLVLSGTTGTIIKWQSSTSSNFSSNVIDINSSNDSLIVSNLNVKTFYRAIVQNGVCPADTSNIDSIVINSLSIAGTLSGSDSICVSAIPSSNLLTLTSYTGTIVKWQSSFTADFSSLVSDIVNTADTYTASGITQTTYYRVIVNNGVCAPDTSNIVHIFVTPPSVGGSVSGTNPFNPNVIVCSGTNTSTLVLSGHIGLIIKWQSSLTNDFSGTITDIANTTSSLTVTNLTSTTYYRVIVKSGECDSAFSTIKVITVNPTTNAGDVSSDTVCTGTNSSVLHLTNYIGDIIKWQSSSSNDFTSGVVDLMNTTDSLLVTNINATIFYRVIVKSGVCPADTSTIGHILVNSPTIAGTLNGGDTICAGVNATTLVLSGTTGTIIKWQSSSSSDFSSSIIDINSTNDSLLVSNLNTTTFYRVIVQNGVCPADTSTIDSIVVNSPSIAGVLSGGDTICAGTNLSTLILTGVTGNIIQWQSSTTSNFSSNVIDINSFNDSLIVSNLNTTTFYRVIVQNGVCPADTSTFDSIVVNTPSIAGTLSGGDTVCAGVNATTLVLSGTTGTIIKWQSSTTSYFSSNVIDINSTNDSLIVSNLNTSTFYRVIVQNGVCPADISTIDSIVVNSPSIAGTLSGGDTVCAGTNLSTLILTGVTGNIIQWQSSTTSNFSSNVIDINSTNDSLIVSNLNTTTFYRVIVQNGACPADTSTIDSIIVNSPSIAGILSGGDTVCAGVNATTLVLSGTTGTIIKWQSSSSSDFSSSIIDINSTNNSLLISNLNVTTFYRVIVQNGVCPADTSTIDSIVVNSPSIAGTLSGGDTVCAGANATTLVLSGTTGTIIKWQSSTTSNFSSNVIDINSTNDSLIVSNLNTTTFYRVIVQNGICPADTSNIVNIKVVSSAFTNIIYSPNPDLFLVSGNPDSILGSVQLNDSSFYFYQWQQSISSDSTTFVNINGANSFYYDPPLLNESTWYRRILYSLICPINDTSNTVRITIIPVVNNPSPIIGASLSVDKPIAITPGSYHVDYTITLKNMGNVDLENIKLIENFSTVFLNPSTFSIVNIVADNGLSVNSNFDGISNSQLLDSSNSTLLIGESKLIKIRLLVSPNLPDVTYYNQVYVYADMSNGIISVMDSSVKGDNPDPNNNGTPEEQSLTDVSISIFVPSGYSPNGDGKNDEFIIVGIENFPNNRLEIYNRWGNKVFEQAPYDNTWKGTVKNTDGFVIGEGLLPSGTYFYLLDFGIPGVKQLTGYIVIRK